MFQIRHLFTTLLFFSLFGLRSLAQDTIFYYSGSYDLAKVMEIDENSVKFKKWSIPDGPLYTVSKTKVSLIIYANGSADLFEIVDSLGQKVEQKHLPAAGLSNGSTSVTNTAINGYSNNELYQLGRIDAMRSYRAHKTVGTVTFLSGIYPFLSVPVGLLFLATNPSETNFVSDQMHLFNDPNYTMSYERKAREMRHNSAMKNMAITSGFWLGVLFVALLSF